MKFDLLDAMMQMDKLFGDAGEILVRQNKAIGISVTLRTFRYNRFHNHQFVVPYRDIDDSNVNSFNMKFHESLRALYVYVENLEPPSVG